MSEQTVTKPENKTKTHPMYKVIMHNDDKSTMQFVIFVLMAIFGKKPRNATELMLEVHTKKQALVGVYVLEQAELRVDQCHSMARARGYPLTCTIEPA